VETDNGGFRASVTDASGRSKSAVVLLLDGGVLLIVGGGRGMARAGMFVLAESSGYQPAVGCGAHLVLAGWARGRW